MSDKTSNNETPNGLKSYHDLSEVKKKIKSGDFVINEDVSRDADYYFGWKTKDIKKAYLKLNPKDFVKSDNSKKKYLRIVDVYKANIEGTQIYTHFYIDINGMLVINSLHKP